MAQKGVLTLLIKNLTEVALEGELESHFGQGIIANHQNGKGKNSIKLLSGNLITTPHMIL